MGEPFGHTMTLKVRAKPAGRWEAKLLRAIHTADAFICLLTANGMGSGWVVSQTGMAMSGEFTKNMLVLPVCPKGEIPDFASAFHCFWLLGTGSNAVNNLAKQLDGAIQEHRAAQPPRIFISHRHSDKNIAGAVIDLLESAFDIEKSDIRCTSVSGYKLAVGSPSADSLQADLIGAEIVIGVVGPETAKSDYVLFELGAAWGLRKPTFPLRIRGATFENIPEVLREKSSLALDDVSQCLQLVEDVGRISSIARKESFASDGGAETLHEQAELLSEAAKA